MDGSVAERTSERTNERRRESAHSQHNDGVRSFIGRKDRRRPTRRVVLQASTCIVINNTALSYIAKRGVGMHELVLSTDDLRCVVWVFRGLYGYACCVAREKLRGKEGRRHKRNDARCNDAMTRGCNDAMTRRCNDAMTRRCNHEMMQ